MDWKKIGECIVIALALGLVVVLLIMFGSKEKDDTKYFKKLSYDGHQYIIYNEGRSDGGVGMVHSPDCKCNND